MNTPQCDRCGRFASSRFEGTDGYVCDDCITDSEVAALTGQEEREIAEERHAEELQRWYDA